MEKAEIQICSKCKKEKPINEFYKSHCRTCHDYNTTYRDKNKHRAPIEQYCEFCKYDVLKKNWKAHSVTKNHLLNKRIVEEVMDEKQAKKEKQKLVDDMLKKQLETRLARGHKTCEICKLMVTPEKWEEHFNWLTHRLACGESRADIIKS